MHRTIAILATLVLASTAAGGLGANESIFEFRSQLSRAQEVPTPGPGSITRADALAEFTADLSAVSVRLRVDGGHNVVAAHFHCALPGVTGPVAFGLFSPGPLQFDGVEASGVLTNEHFSGADCTATIDRPVNNIAALALAMREGLIYINVHTSDNPPGEVRGQMIEVGGPPFRRIRPLR